MIDWVIVKKKKKIKEVKWLNAKLKRHMAGPHALPHKVSTFIYTSV